MRTFTTEQEKLILITVEFYIKAQGHIFTDVLSADPAHINELKQLREILKHDLMQVVGGKPSGEKPSEEEFIKYFLDNHQSRKVADNAFFVIDRKGWKDIHGNSIVSDWKAIVRKNCFK